MYRAHARRIFAYALRRTSRDEASDVVAETFLVAWRRLREVPDDPLPWLIGVARNVVANRQRSSRRRMDLSSKLAQEATSAPQAALDPAEMSDARHAIHDALTRLRPWDQEALRLIAWDGLDHKQAAQAMGCTSSTFAVRLHRARRRFEAQLASAANEPTRDLAKEIG